MRYCQPKVNMRTSAVIGVDALIRWQHPDEGLLAPAVFLPVIGEPDLAVAVGEWVIDTALSQIEHWHSEGLALPEHFNVNVKMGARQFQQGNLARPCRTCRHPAGATGDRDSRTQKPGRRKKVQSKSDVFGGS